MSEPLAGLEHVLSWRPSGNLIASTQRFGSLDGLGAGREGRHDVVFFERNGLRHGEFDLRPASSGTNGQANPGTPNRDYKIRELAWNTDSNVLAVWKETAEEDVGVYPGYLRSENYSDRPPVQLWTIGNYHWFCAQIPLI